MSTAFGIEEPRLYVSVAGEHAASPNAIVIGANDLTELPPDELAALLAHECGHLALGHAQFRQLARHGDPSQALRNWLHASELSADRAAAVYAGSADAITRVIFREAARAEVHSCGQWSGPGPANRVREIQAWTATPGFARLSREPLRR